MKRIFFLISVTLLLTACKHELENPTWDVEMIVPLAHTKMNINNIISDSNLNIIENNEGFIHLFFYYRISLDNEHIQLY